MPLDIGSLIAGGSNFMEALWKQEDEKCREVLAIRANAHCKIILHNALKRRTETNFCEVIQTQSK